MKKLLVLLALLPLMSFGQILLNQSIVEPGPYTAGQVVTMQYTVDAMGKDLNYILFRFQYSNKHLQLVDGSTVFTQGGSKQTYFTQWVNYTFNPKSTIGIGDLLGQYKQSWSYTTNPDWNVVQISVQNTLPIQGVIATQKFIIKPNTDYTYVHKFEIANATIRTGSTVSSIGSSVLFLSLNGVYQLTSGIKFKITFPEGYDISQHTIVVKEQASGLVVAQGQFDSSGEFIAYSLKKTMPYNFQVLPVNAPWIDDIVTVTDAYRSFLAINDTGIDGTSSILSTPLEKGIANIDSNNIFDSQDAYYLFAKVMGMDLSGVQNLEIPIYNSTNTVKFYAGLSQGFENLEYSTTITPTQDVEQYQLSYAWGGDLDFSHSTPLPLSAQTRSAFRTKAIDSNTTINTAIQNGKVVVEVGLTSTDLAGSEYKLGYDDSKLELESIVFDAGSTITNFNTHKGNIIIFGSIDKTGTKTIKPGTPYKLIFKPKTTLTNTSGLVYTYFAEAVTLQGTKVNLNIE